MKSKVICIHFPAYHCIPENDIWWGTGFTEWNNVRLGKPLYCGHYQPRKPFKNNYYDLSDIRVLEHQIKLAMKANIGGFAFYHYWFQGKKFFEKPIEQYRDKSKLEFPYCLIWANQSWYGTWHNQQDKNNIKMLQKQMYGNIDDWNRHFMYLLDFFRDERYIKINNKPLYIIYVPQDIECRKDMFETWNDLAIRNGFNGIYLIAMNTFHGCDRKKKLYNAFLNLEPHNTLKKIDSTVIKLLEEWKTEHINYFHKNKKDIRNCLYVNNIYTYPYMCRQIIKNAKKEPDKKTFLGVFQGWDNTPRMDEYGMIMHGNTPDRFRKLVEYMLKKSEQQGNEYLFLNAWNEWSEGTYMEPDEKYGYAFLNSLKKAISNYEKS